MEQQSDIKAASGPVQTGERLAKLRKLMKEQSGGRIDA